MRIGVDARLLCGPVTGIGRTLFEIGKRLCFINSDIIFYAPRKTDFDSVLNIRTSSFDDSLLKGKFFDQFWSQTILPLYAKMDNIDVFWGPAHRLPFLLPKSIAQVLTIHDLLWITHPETMGSFGYILEKIHMPYSLTNADKIIAISNSTRRGILDVFPEVGSKLSVISLGSTSFPLERNIEVLKKFEINQGYILFVGTIEPRKNLTRLIQAYSRLSSYIKSQYDLVIVGSSGWGNMNLSRLIELNDLSKNVKMIGYVSDEDLAYLYQHAVFLAMPSLSEGFGLPILEAMSAGIPVLTSNCSSLPEIAGDAALLVDPLSVDSIQRGLEKLLIDSQFRMVLSSNAKKNSLKYSWDDCSAQTMAVFEEAIALRDIRMSRS